MKMKCVLTLVLILCLLLGGCKPSGDKETMPTFPPLPTDPEEQKNVAFTCYNYNFDFFVGYSMAPALSFYILTREYVDVTDIAVTIPVEQSYDVYIYDDSTMNDYYQLTEHFKDADGVIYTLGEHDLQYLPWLYQTSRGIDWKALGEKRLKWQQASDQYEKLYEDNLLNTPEGAAAWDELSKASAEYAAASGTFLEDYSQLTPADLPTFYMYRVEILFKHDPEIENSSFREIQVDVAGKSQTIPIGEIRLHNEMIGETEDGVPALSFASSGPIHCDTYPYGPGIQKREGDTLTTKKDVTLLGCELAASDTSTLEILEIQLTIGGMDMVWDGKTPIQIPKGKQVKFDFVIRDDRLQELFYGGMLTPVVTYEHEGQTYSYAMSLSMHRWSLPPWLWYTVCFQGLNLESYFNDYYYYAVDTEWKEYQS